MNYATIFPGQGSQSLGMLNELSGAHPVVKATFSAASKILGYDLWDLCQNGPQDKLNQTLYTQPAMLAGGIAAYRVWQQQASKPPRMTAGHSLGEYSALVCAGSITFEDAVALVAERARLMTDTIPTGVGAMAAIVGLSDEDVSAVCKESAEGEVVSPANFNSIGQVVIAGHTKAVERAINAANAKGAKLAMFIPVSAPCHCDLLKPAAEKFAQALENTKVLAPEFPVIRNIDAELHEHPDDIRHALQAQLFQPVQWVKTILRLKDEGMNALLEPGPGRVLTGLTKRIDREFKTFPLCDSATLSDALKELY